MTIIFTLLFNYSVYSEIKNNSLTQKERSEVIKAIGKELNDNYIFPDVAKKMHKHISKQNKKGRYKNIDDPMVFSNKLTEDLLSISHDKHIRVSFNPEAIARQKQAVTDEERQKLQQQGIDRFKKTNFGFKQVKILDGNIGYLDLRSFADTSFAGDTAIAVMNYLSNADAIIFDLRNNGGGSPAMIQLITSYLYNSEPVHLNNFYWRPTNLNTQTWTLPYVPGKRSPDTPVFVLTSGSTFSAAEEFSYNLKNLERATLIGETTGGGAHPGDTVNATDRFQIWVPSGRAINPITNTNWEGTGVVPHIKVNQEDALKTAHIKALETIMDKSSEESKMFYSWTLDALRLENNPVIIDSSALNSYVGNYGPRVVSLEDNSLYYQRGTGNKYKLTPMGNNKFLIKELSYFRIQFETKDNKVTALIGTYDNGRTDKNLKD